MNPTVEMASLNLEELSKGDKDTVTKSNMTVESGAMGTNVEKNLIRTEDINFKTRIKRHTEKENEISISDQGKESEMKRHLTEEFRNESFASTKETLWLPPSAENVQDGRSELALNGEKENLDFSLSKDSLEDLKRQNCKLMEALVRMRKTRAIEKKRYHEILFGLDKALSSLPIRLEKIRVRNQRNLTIINSSRFNSGDGHEISEDIQSACESLPSGDSEMEVSRDSQSFVSFRMKCLLRKMDQLNDLMRTIQEKESPPIEFLVDSELCAISLLKNEIRSTKKQIESSKTDTETVASFGETHRDLVEDSSSKAKNSFSNELNKASNFKIFENHMMLQEEALNLLTRKIKETEEALLKEIEAKEGLKRENEALAKEIFRLKSAGEESKGEKSQKTEKLKLEVETTGTRPYRLIKELKTKLEEKEKALMAWKSKYTRLEAASSNKTVLIEAEKKKNYELEMSVKNLKTQNKNMNSCLTSLQFLNEQLKDQMEILKQQVDALTTEKIKREVNSPLKNAKIEIHVQELNEILRADDEKIRKMQGRAKSKIQEIKMYCERDIESLGFQLKKCQEVNQEFEETFKKLLIVINNVEVEKHINNIRNPSYNRIREILRISPSDLELLFSAYAKTSAEEEAEVLFEEFKSIISEEGEKFSEKLSSWFFDILAKKFLQCRSGQKKDDLIGS